jgi:hypothetical protein
MGQAGYTDIMTFPLRTARPAATSGLAARQIPPELLRLLGGSEDESIDCLETDRPQATLDTSLQPSRDLLRGPTLCKAIHHEGSQALVLFQDSGALATVEI